MSTESPLRGKTILAVDDEPDILTTLGELLGMCEVVKKTNYDDAVEYLNSNSPDLAAHVITLAEAEFQDSMVLYGELLRMDEEDLVDALAVYLAGFADAYLDAIGKTLPPGVDLVSTIRSYIVGSMLLCESDYATEIDATIIYVDAQMELHGIGNRQ